MPHTTIMDTQHPDYDVTIDAVHLVRDTIEGPNAVKNGPRSKVYLPNPTDTEILNSQDKLESNNNYATYKSRAEFDGFPARTESGYMGALKSTPPALDKIPSDIEYLILDSDGDGLTLSESIEITQANLLEVKFHGLLADFNGLTDNDINNESKQLTQAQAKAAGLKATIKHYPRESIKDWDYGVVNNQNQLTYVKLSEKTSEINRETFERVEVENQLILGLDEDGFYFQMQITVDDKGVEVKSEMLYPENNGGKMDFIPFEIVIEQKKQSSALPRALGILYPVCLKAVDRYQVKADLKYSLLKDAQPTLKSSGWDERKNELFIKMNPNGAVLGSGQHIAVPFGVEMEYLQWDADSNAMFKYLEENQKEAKALGARFDTSDPKEEAVGVAKIRSAEELSALMNTQTATQESYIRVMTWCFWYMSTNTDIPEIELVLNKEFNKVILTPEERKAILDDFMGTIIDHEEAVRQLVKGGTMTPDEAEELLTRMSNSGGFS